MGFDPIPLAVLSQSLKVKAWEYFNSAKGPSDKKTGFL